MKNISIKHLLLPVLLLFQVSFVHSQSLNYGHAHDITNGVSYDGSPYVVAAQNGFPGDIEFSEDGLAMFVLDASNQEIDIYKLTRPFDTSSGVSINGTSFDIADEEMNANGFAFGSQGNKLYVTGSSGDDVQMYSVTNAYDLSALVFTAGTTFSLTDQFSNPRDLVVSTDGTKMFVLEQDQVFQYSLGTAFCTSVNVTYDNVVYSIAGEDTQGRSLAFNQNGTKMYVLGSDGSDLNQYSLAVPFDLSGAISSDGSPFLFTGQETQPRGIALSTDGSKLFMIGTLGDDVNQYSLNVDDNFQESGANSGICSGSLSIEITGDTFTDAGGTLSLSKYSIDNLPEGLTPFVNIAADGLSASLIFSGSADDHQRIHNVTGLQFSFTNDAFTSGDASSVQYAQGYESNFGIDFDNNSAVLSFGQSNDVTQGISVVGTPYSFSAQETNPYGIKFSNDGSKMFIAGIAGDDINQYTLSVPFDVNSSITFDGSPLNVFSQEATLSDITFNNDGSKLYVIGGGNGDEINQYSLDNPFDITSGVNFDDNPLSVNSIETNTKDIYFSTDGFKLFVLGPYSVHQFSLEIPFETRYGVTSGGSAFNFSDHELGAVGMAFDRDGLRLNILGASGQDITQFSLSTPFDVTAGVTIDGSPFTVSNETTVPRSFTFNPEGNKMFVVGSTGGVHQYSLANDNFTETADNLGSVESANLPAVIHLTGDTFVNSNGVLVHKNHYVISNLPKGLTPTLSVAADGKSATFSFSGTANSHQETNNLEDLIFSFVDVAFTGGDAAIVVNSTSTSSGFGIEFDDNPILTYGYEPFDFDAGLSFDNSPFNIAGKEASAKGLAFNNDGTRMFIIGNSSQRAHQYDLDHPFDLSDGVAFDATCSTLFGAGSSGIVFNNDGSKCYVLLGAAGSTKAIREYTLSSNFDLSSTVTFVTSYSIGTQELTPQGMRFSNDGHKMYIVGSNGNEVNQYTLTTAFSLAGTVVHDGNSALTGTPLDIAFSSDGLSMFVLSFTHKNIARYRLNTAFDITDGFESAGDAFSLSAQDASPVAIAFSPDGSKLFMVGSNDDDVYRYTIEIGGFTETEANLGAVEGSLIIQLSGDTFTNANGNLPGQTYNILNLPSGLNPTLAVAADGLTAALTLSGNAPDNYDSDDLSNLRFTFSNAAFTTDNAGAVFNANNASSNFGIDFFGSIITWDGNSWSNGTGPTLAEDAVIEGNFTTASANNILAKNLTINSGVNVTITNEKHIQVAGDLAHNGASLLVESGGSLVTEGDVTGTNFTFQRVTTFNENVGRYSIVGAPVAGASFASLGANAIIYGYDETEAYDFDGNKGLDRFKTPAQLSQTTLQKGQGYFSAKTGDANGKISFSGMPNHELVQFDMTLTDHPSNEDDFEGFNLVSNPYPCAISYTDVLDANLNDIEGAIYIWDDFDSGDQRGTNDDYITANGMGNVDSRKLGLSKFDDHIRSMQGFFVIAKSGGDLEMDFTDDMKVLANNTDGGYFRSIDEQVSFKLTIEDDQGNYAETLIGAKKEADLDLDRYDAPLFSQASTQLYSFIGDRAYAIQGIPSMDHLALPLGMKTEGLGQHTIAMTEDQNLEELEIVLIDHELNVQTNLSRGEQYTFTPNGVARSRFTVVAKRGVLAIDDQSIADWMVFQNQMSQLVLRASQVESIQSAELISLSGQRTGLTFTQQNSLDWAADLRQKEGLFVVRIISDNQELIQRVILK